MLAIDRFIANDDEDAKFDLLVGFLAMLGSSSPANAAVIDRAFEEAVAGAPNAVVAGQLRDAWTAAREPLPGAQPRPRSVPLAKLTALI